MASIQLTDTRQRPETATQPKPERVGARRFSGIAGIAYVVLFVATFPMGVGAHLYGHDAPAAVAAWSSGHAALVQQFVFLGLVGDWLFVLFVLLLVAATSSRSAGALIGCVGIAAAETVYAVVRGLQYALPQVGGLTGGDQLAQAAVVVQSTLVFFVYPLPFAIGWGAIGYVLARGNGVLKVFGVVAIILAFAYAISFPLQQLAPTTPDFVAVVVQGLLLWTLAISVALLLPRRLIRVRAFPSLASNGPEGGFQ